MSARPYPVLAGILPIRHALDARYSSVGTRLVFQPDLQWSRIGFGRGTRAEASQSAALRTDAITALERSRLRPSAVGDSYDACDILWLSGS
jgi:hypothetical protein